MDPRNPDPRTFARDRGPEPGWDPRREPAFSLAHPRLTLFVVLFLVALVALRSWGSRPQPRFDPDAELRPVVARGDLAADEQSTIRLFEIASPSVVNIATQRAYRSGGLFARTVLVPEGTGSGFVWDEDGHVVTNFHVVQRAAEARATFGNGQSFDLAYVGGLPEYDLVVLRVDAPAALLRPLALGSSADLRVGQKAFAIGYPFGLDQTLTTGVISGLDRTIDSVTERPLTGVIQTDAAINPGNSGGPLLDSAGRLIGVNTAIASRSGSSAGVGFAIPVDSVNQIVTALIRGEETRRTDGPPQLGILVDLELATLRGIRGVVVREVVPGSGAEAAGLQGYRYDRRGALVLGDVILALDGKQVRDFDDLRALLAEHQPGDAVMVTLERGPPSEREQVDVSVTLGG